MSTPADERFLAALEDGSLTGLDHEGHVRFAWLTLRAAPLLQALERIRRVLAAYAAARGQPEVYHETITWAFTLLIHERMARGPGDGDWRRFLERNGDLRAGRSALDGLYSRELLDSDLARRTFVLPDRPSRRRSA